MGLPTIHGMRRLFSYRWKRGYWKSHRLGHDSNSPPGAVTSGTGYEKSSASSIARLGHRQRGDAPLRRRRCGRWCRRRCGRHRRRRWRRQRLQPDVELPALAGREHDLGRGKRPRRWPGIFNAKAIRARLQPAEDIRAVGSGDDAAIDAFGVGDDERDVARGHAVGSEHRALHRRARGRRRRRRKPRRQRDLHREHLARGEDDRVLAEWRKSVVVGANAIRTRLQPADARKRP